MEMNHRLKSVPPDKDDLIVVAYIAKTRGLRGEVVADLQTDFPDRFEHLDSLIGIGPDQAQRSLQIEEQWFHGNRLVLKFAGFDRIEEAKELVGLHLAVPATERIELPSDSFYQWELAGCRVETVGGQHVGEVKDVMRTGGVEILEVVGPDGREMLIPMATDICVGIDIENKLIRIDPPPAIG